VDILFSVDTSGFIYGFLLHQMDNIDSSYMVTVLRNSESIQEKKVTICHFDHVWFDFCKFRDNITEFLIL